MEELEYEECDGGGKVTIRDADACIIIHDDGSSHTLLPKEADFDETLSMYSPAVKAGVVALLLTKKNVEAYNRLYTELVAKGSK